MQSPTNQQISRQVQQQMSGLLHGLGDEDQSQQTTCSGDARISSQDAGITWPGKDIGIRGPEDGETALSWDEVYHGVATGVLP